MPASAPQETQPPSAPPAASLRRAVGIYGAVMMGLGSILGTGVFVSIGIGAGAAGPAVVLAILLAAGVAACNGLSSAQLAANHPVSGGAYEYGYRWLHPSLGFTAGWMFLCAKSASAATAALGLAGYLLHAFGASAGIVPLAAGTVVVLTILALTGIQRSSLANIVIVSLTLFALLLFVAAGLPLAWRSGVDHMQPFFAPTAGTSKLSGLLEACALMFVAYTGYGRIATLGEEMQEPRTNIPRAIILTLAISMTLYLAVSMTAISAVGAGALAAATLQQNAPLETVARGFDFPGVAILVSVGAATAMLGVLLNLILGLSRVALAMGRRGDLPPVLARLNQSQSTPYAAVIAVGAMIAALTLIGNVRTTWSFSAFTVLVYYALTNLAALRLTREERLYPVWIPWIGLCSCLFLACWVETRIWLTGFGLIAAGLLWQQIARRLFPHPQIPR
ncbi:APC family permease [Lignipirellula cremea]|uniref:Putative amino acid permease YhdG n=1 Tax=Lignipirellula cremea TaxID=2528010 RepID=A0A518E4K4_9BACT|nr:APC family permease [Lignipirellula cremea]QDU98998.1 putative amino acid permease YhdG [Lignipirellula cremea]